MKMESGKIFCTRLTIRTGDDYEIEHFTIADGFCGSAEIEEMDIAIDDYRENKTLHENTEHMIIWRYDVERDGGGAIIGDCMVEVYAQYSCF